LIEYKTFFKNASIIGLIIVLIVLAVPKIFSPIISDKNVYAASTIDKENRLAKLESPKIVIVGGSGSAFSINSKMIEDSLKMPVVNMAVSYGLGLTYMLEESKNGIKKGDKILLFTEYYLPVEGSKKLLTLINDLNPIASEYFKFSVSDWIKFRVFDFQRVGSSLFYKTKNTEINDPITLRSSFNEYGDMTAHLNKPNRRPLKDVEKLHKTLYTKELAELNDFVKFCKKVGVNVYYGFPAFPATEYDENKKAIKYFEWKLKKNFKGKILNTPEANLYPENDFYDTIYHLNTEGREKRTQYLIKLLKPIIK
jgi:hypothetical protein